MTDHETYYKDHWVAIEPERFDRYDKLFRVDDARADQLLAPVGVRPGDVVLDFGCGPGYIAAQLARMAGPEGHVHAADVNEAFLERARAVVSEAGVADRVTFHHVIDERLPLADGTVDRAYAKNVLEYVPDADATVAELARVVRPGGTLVASDSDFGFVVVEPLTPAEVAELFEAAAPAFRDPNIGRHLPGAFRRAGFDKVSVRIQTSPDERGYMRSVIENMIGYGLRFGRLDEARAADIRARIDAALANGTYLAALPQWWVTGTR